MIGNRTSGFTLMEIILALALSSIILVALGRLMTSSYAVKTAGDERMMIDRQISQLYNQLENDLGGAFGFVPLEEDETVDSPKDEKKQTTDVTKSSQASQQKVQEKKPSTPLFIANVYDEKIKNAHGAMIPMTKKLSFVTTSVLPLGKTTLRAPVRVMYELMGNVKRSSDTATQFTLRRSEMTDLTKTNANSAQHDKDKPTAQQVIVAQNIKAFSVELVALKEKPLDDIDKQTAQKTKKPIEAYSWGGDEKTKERMPMYARVYLEFWNNDQTRSYTAQPQEWMFKIYGTNTQSGKQKAKKNNAAPVAAKPAQAPGQNATQGAASKVLVSFDKLRTSGS